MDNNKKIFCVRHGLALHNILIGKIGLPAYCLKEYFDTPLLAEGHNQARQLGEKWIEKKNIQMVLVSPLFRTLETMENIFPRETKIKVIAHELVKEFPQGLHICNKRKKKSHLKYLYDYVDFSLIDSESDMLWRSNRVESVEELSERVRKVKDFLKTRIENRIAIISHSAFLQFFMFNDLGDGIESLKHCYPYLYELSY